MSWILDLSILFICRAHIYIIYIYVRLVLPSYLFFYIYFIASYITCCPKREEALEIYNVISEVLVLDLLVVYKIQYSSWMYLYIPAMYFCCCSVLCSYTTAVAAAVAVRHRVPDGKICCCGSLHLIPVVLSLHSNTNYFQCTPWQYCESRIYSVDFFPIVHIIHPR